MKAKPRPNAATVVLGDNIRLDVVELLRSNLAIVGNSGCGKTQTGRQLLEALHDITAQVIVDPAGEMWTLREHFDYMIVGHRGEIPADPALATDLARFVREKSCRVIIDLSRVVDEEEQQRFLRVFGDALLRLPDDLWRVPLVFFVDEVQIFAPQEERPPSRKTIGNLATIGRKQKICTIVATQRLADTSKRVMNSINNRMYGRFPDPVDLEPASRQLGFVGRSEWKTMQAFLPGDFYVKGPAFGHEGAIRGHTSGKTKSKHIDRSESLGHSPPPVSKAIAALVKELASKHAGALEAAKAEKSEIAALRSRVKDLEGGAELKKLRERIRQLETAPAPKSQSAPEERVVVRSDPKELESARRDGFEEGWKTCIEKGIAILAAKVKPCLFTAEKHLAEAQERLRSIEREPPAMPPMARHRPRPAPLSAEPQVASPRSVARSNGRDDGSLKPTMRKILTALAQFGELDFRSLALFGQVSMKSSGFNITLAQAKRAGWISGTSKAFQVTDAGKAILGSYERLPSGPALLDYWTTRFGAGAGRMLRVVLDAGPDGIDLPDLAYAAGISEKSSQLNVDLAMFRKLRLFHGGRPIRATDTLFRMAR